MHSQTLFLESTGIVLVSFGWEDTGKLIIGDIRNAIGNTINPSESDMLIINEIMNSHHEGNKV